MIPRTPLTVFSDVPCKLGEGPLWHPQRQSLFWLDILNKTLYEKTFDSLKSDYDRSWSLPWLSSVMAIDKERNEILWIVSEHCLGKFNLTNGRYTPVLKLPISESFRTNDGSISPDGDFWFGTMEKKPESEAGTIYSITPQGKLIEQLAGVGIPNTFAWLNNGREFLISDSLRQRVLCYQIHNGRIQEKTKEVYLDLGLTEATPDGGAVDANGSLWNAQWDGYSVVCYNGLGTQLQSVELPIPRPTSCCFGGPENKHLFITSARDGMTQNEITQYPSSGNVFVIELPVTGLEIPFFHWESEC